MKKFLEKELRLSASPLSFLFTLFGLMALIPNYPILLGAFFICFGIFHSFQNARENADMVYSVLLPISKSAVVKSKYGFCVFIEGCGFFIMTVSTLVRMAFLRETAAYTSSVLMNANFVYLAFALLIFACFNLIFVGGFFKTAFYFAKPFIGYILVTFLLVGLGETLHHIPPLEVLNVSGFEEWPLQLSVLATGIVLYTVITGIALKKSIHHFEKIDL